MHISVIAVGKLKERFWREACDEYAKRLRPYARVDVVEVPDADPARCGGEAQARVAEARGVLSALPRGAASRHVVCLDIGGELATSEGIAGLVEELGVRGCGDLAFVVGGSTGLDESVLRLADERLSFGRITLPHNLARVVLLEQLYRAYRIIRGEPYHK